MLNHAQLWLLHFMDHATITLALLHDELPDPYQEFFLNGFPLFRKLPLELWYALLCPRLLGIIADLKFV
jgi:hypothetical protein